MQRMTDTRIVSDNRPLFVEEEGCQAGAPFARLALGGQYYDIAHEICDDDLEADPGLAFQRAGKSGWSRLSRSVADGWTRIGADILLTDPKSLVAFLTTHAVRIQGDYNFGETVVYDTLGIRWSARLVSENEVQVRLGIEPWHSTIEEKPSASPKERAIQAFVSSHPETSHLFRQEIDNWAHRIATGVQIEPVF